MFVPWLRTPMWSSSSARKLGTCAQSIDSVVVFCVLCLNPGRDYALLVQQSEKQADDNQWISGLCCCHGGSFEGAHDGSPVGL